MIERIESLEHLERLAGEHPSFLMLFFHRESSESSRTALERLREAVGDDPETPLCIVDVQRIRRIHPRYDVRSVPTVVVLKDGRMIRKVAGLQTREYYEMLLGDAPAPASARRNGKKARNVIVYTSPTCSWCGALKSYLRKNRIPFREVDISRDERAARDLVRRSGQMGVPQTEIDGKIIVGFDRAALDRRLGIQGTP